MMSAKQFVKYSFKGIKHRDPLRIYYNSILNEYFQGTNWIHDSVIVYNDAKANILFNWLKDQKENKMEAPIAEKLTRYTFNVITDFCDYISSFGDMHAYADTMSCIGKLSHALVHTEYAYKASIKGKNRDRLLELCDALELQLVDKKEYYTRKKS